MLSKYENVLISMFLDCLGTSFENGRSIANLYLIGVLYKYRSGLDFDVLSYCDELTISNQVWGSGNTLEIRERRMILMKIVVDLLSLCNNRRKIYKEW